jgi:two-component system sensor histidine kinase FlrB
MSVWNHMTRIMITASTANREQPGQEAPASLATPDQQSPPPGDNASLREAFELFNQVSGQLSESYNALEERIVELNSELHEVDQQRLRELQEKERLSQQLRNLLDLLPGGVVVLDKHGVIVDCNPAAIDLLGEPLLGQKWLAVIERCFAPRGDDGHEISLKDGRRVSLATRSLDAEPGQIILLTDQTETRRLQQKLSHHERLQAMGRMMGALAHQLRTPLSTAMLYAGHLNDGQLNEEQGRRFSGKILARLKHMERQIRDMLVFVRGEVKLADTVTTNALVDAILGNIELPDGQPPVTVRVEQDVEQEVLQCNQETLAGAVLNLLDNAFHAAGNKGNVALSVASLSEGRIGITVTDDGPGFDESAGKNLGETFYTTKPQGTGLGLAVVRSVAKAHGGEFSIESQGGKGAVATLVLPLSRRAADEAAPLKKLKG